MVQLFRAGTDIRCGHMVVVGEDRNLYIHLPLVTADPIGVATHDIAKGDMVLLGYEQADDNRYDVVQKASIRP